VWRRNPQPGPWQVWLQRFAILVSATKGLLVGALGGWLMWHSTLPMDGLVARLESGIALLLLVGAVGYLLAAFLLSRPSLGERCCGAIFDAAITAIVARVIISMAERPGEVVLGNSYEATNAVPQAVILSIAAVWIATSVPMLTFIALTMWSRWSAKRELS